MLLVPPERHALLHLPVRADLSSHRFRWLGYEGWRINVLLVSRELRSTLYFLELLSISSITARCRMHAVGAGNFCIQCTTDHTEEHVSGQFAATELCISQCALHQKRCL